MRIIESWFPKYTVEFQHPDDGVEIHTFFIEDTEWERKLFDDGDHPGRFNAELKKAVWKKFNSSGYWHTMTLIAEQVFDGEVYRTVICKEEYCGF